MKREDKKLSLTPSNCPKDSWLNELWFKRYIKKCTFSHVLINTHHDVTDLVNNGMVKNAKTWLSGEQNITFLWNKKILNLYLSWHILRSYCFVAEVTFKPPVFEKRMDLVLSSPKWIHSLLSRNHWYSDENSLFKTFSVF